MNLTEKDNFFDLLSLWLRQHALVSSGMGSVLCWRAWMELIIRSVGEGTSVLGGLGEAKMNVML